MINDYKDCIDYTAKYQGISRCMKDIYKSLNMDYMDYAGIRGDEKKSEFEYKK